MMQSRSTFGALFAMIWIAPGSLFPADAEIGFNRDIRPILSGKCFQCHGPDEEARKGDLRLDFREEALQADAIKPGDPASSQLIHRITTADQSDVMPPRKTKKRITKREAELLREWIQQGANYQEHWSFQPIDFGVVVPKVSDNQWPKNNLDRFVFAKLEERGLKPSPPAAPHTLARRLSIDLTGLLPAPERVAAFSETFRSDPDSAVAAYVDELLASRHYGERWGRHWLDQARYADSHGYTIDGERIMWPYRDWVIRALNRDMPFDQFTIEQLAGDLLPSPVKDQLIASAFHRNTLINQEGGTDDEQFRNEEVADRVNTTGAVWLGLTLSCAQCHTHKFDPVTQREYYELFAFFNQGADVNNTGAVVPVTEGELFADQQDPEKIEKFETARAVAAKLKSTARQRRTEWIAARRDEWATPESGAQWESLKPKSFRAEGNSPLKLLPDDSILAGRGGSREVYRVALPAFGKEVAAIRLRLIPHESLPKNGPGLAGNGNIVLNRIEFRENGKLIPVASAQHSHAQPGFSAASTIDGDPKTGWAINVGKGTRPGTKMNAPHEAHFIFAKPLSGNASVEVVLRHETHDHYNIGRFALDASKTKPVSIGKNLVREILRKPDKDWSAQDQQTLDSQFALVDEPLLRANQELEAARRAIGFGKDVNLMIMKDLAAGKQRKTYLLTRGDFLRPDKELGPLQPGVPAIFPALDSASPDENDPRTRLHLARWIVRPDHPLTPRVTVNRVWMRYFGKGLVETENDFGTQGTFPTHPKLLDWLSAQFVSQGWSMKKLHRLIVTSASYRQASHARPDLREIDPLNHLLARQNRIRFDAEIVRDAALCSSGLLNPKIGGPPVTPAQPDGVYSFTQTKKQWVVPGNEERFRRALYVKFIRSAPYPLFTTFDSPDFQSVCTARSRSNTPLQSLALANDAALFEMARGLGARLLSETSPGADLRDRLALGFRLCFSREPAGVELRLLEEYLRQQEESFSGDPQAAQSVAPQPGQYPDRFSAASAASWVSVARALMNTDEFITRE